MTSAEINLVKNWIMDHQPNLKINTVEGGNNISYHLALNDWRLSVRDTLPIIEEIILPRRNMRLDGSYKYVDHCISALNKIMEHYPLRRDILLTLYESTGGLTGINALEVEPTFDGDRTIELVCNEQYINEPTRKFVNMCKPVYKPVGNVRRVVLDIRGPKDIADAIILF